MAAQTRKKEIRLIQYLIKQNREEFVIEIPENWKVTFASVNPASERGFDKSHCVRVYEMPGSKLRAVFDSATGLRDLNIPLARKVKTEVGKSEWTRDSAGNFKEAVEVSVDHHLEAEHFADDDDDNDF